MTDHPLQQALGSLKNADAQLDRCSAKAKRLLRDHPDSIVLTEAAESLEEKGLLPNLTNPSLPTYKN